MIVPLTQGAVAGAIERGGHVRLERIPNVKRDTLHEHMDRYLEELEWRYNNRDNPHIFRDALARIMHTVN